jgi:hypothetical protein
MKQTDRFPAGVRLLGKTIRKLDQTSERLGISRAAVVELLVWKCADRLQPISLDAQGLPPGSRGRKGQGRRKPQT